MTKQLFSAKFRAHTNIALIKYWGKRNKELFLPVTNSLSLTLDAFYTDTEVEFDTSLTSDVFYLDGVLQNDFHTAKVSRFLDLFRKEANRPNLFATVRSINHVPTAAGLASSASAFAALAGACNLALDLAIDTQTLSTFARQGSGSASRSLLGGFVEWHKGQGDDSASSYAEAFDDADWDLAMVFVIINRQAKKVDSRLGMEHTNETSPFYELWPREVAKDLEKIKPAIKAHDIDTVGAIAEHNAMKMHAMTIAANPSFTYWEPGSIEAMQIVRRLREEGISAYLTMDAGPNVKVLCRASEAERVKAAFVSRFGEEQIIIAKPGPNAYPLDKE